MRLRDKVFITFAILVLVPLIIISIVVHQIFSNSKLEDITSNTENYIIQLNNSLDLMVDDASRSTLSLLYNKQLIDILSFYSQSTTGSYRNNEDINTFSLFLSGIMYKKDSFHGIHIFSKKGHVFSHMGNSTISDKIKLEAQPWYQAIKKADGGWVLYPEAAQSYYLNDSSKYISFIRLLKDPTNLHEIGIVKVDFSPAYIEKLTKQLPGESWQILSDDRPLFRSNNHPLLKGCMKNKTWIAQKNQDYICITNTSSFSGIQVNSIIPKDYLYEDIRDFDQSLVLVIVLSLGVSILLSFYVSNYLLKPFEVLKTRIKDFQSKKVNKIDDDFKGEIAELSSTYNDLVSEINQLVEEVYELNLRNSESEYKTLQSKMDPHFIFNTLESINMTALTNKQFYLSDMVSELGSLMRYRLKNEDTLISLQSEINFSKSYVSLMKHRFEDKIQVRWDIDRIASSFLIPKYLIQPLIENAIQHGFAGSPLIIQVSVKLQDGFLTVIVKDNGNGLESDKLTELKRNLSKLNTNNSVEQPSGNGVALINISKRLMLIYGPEYSLKVDSVKSTFTTFKATIPVQGGRSLEEGNGCGRRESD